MASKKKGGPRKKRKPAK